MYEDISGAFLNVAKSVIIPLVNPVEQEWFNRIGCIVLKPGESTIYLGCIIGYNITPSKETQFLLGKVYKRLSHWANSSLSFVGRVILLKHVIRAMPIYHLMSMSLNLQGFDELESVSREFLWGENKEGEFRKLLLVAWKDTALGKAEGGLGFVDLHSISLVLKMRWVSCILEEDTSNWVLLAKESFSRSLDSGFR